MNISLQLYSLREEIAKSGLDNVLATIAQAGFDCVETAGFYGLGYKEFKAKLDKYSLYVSGTHTELADIEEHGKTLEMAAALHTKDIVIPYINPELFKNNFSEIALRIEKAAQFYKTNGLTLGYHNHDFEFGEADILTKLLNKNKFIKSELDVFWLTVAGESFPEYYQKHEGRFLTFHLKELSEKGAEDYNPVLGKGVANIEQAVKTAVKAGFSYVVIEAEKLAIPYAEYLSESVAFVKKTVLEA